MFRLGLDQTSMDDIAGEAGISRRTLYRCFASRDEVFAAAFYWHIMNSAFTEALARTKGLPFDRAMLHGTLASIELGRRDRLIMEFMWGSGSAWYQRQMLLGDSPLARAVKKINAAFWTDILDRARSDGILNPKLSNSDILEWYFSAQYHLIARAQLSGRDQAFAIKNLLIPSFLRRDEDGADVARRRGQRPAARRPRSR